MDAVVMICLKRPNNTMLLLTSTEKGKLGMMLRRDCCLVLSYQIFHRNLIVLISCLLCVATH